MNGAECLVRTAVGAGVEVCFANPGTTETPLVAALDSTPGMRAVPIASPATGSRRKRTRWTRMRERDDRYFTGYAKLLGQVYARYAEEPTHAQRFPSDYEAQGSQGPITLHSEERLVTSDKAIVLLRRVFREQMAIVKAGGDPLNTVFKPGDERVVLEAGSFVTPAAD